MTKPIENRSKSVKQFGQCLFGAVCTREMSVLIEICLYSKDVCIREMFVSETFVLEGCPY